MEELVAERDERETVVSGAQKVNGVLCIKKLSDAAVFNGADDGVHLEEGRGIEERLCPDVVDRQLVQVDVVNKPLDRIVMQVVKLYVLKE